MTTIGLILTLAIIAVVAGTFWLSGRDKRFLSTGLRKLADEHGWTLFSEEPSGQVPYEGGNRDATKGLQRTKMHPEEPKGESFEYVTHGIRGSYRGRTFVTRRLKLDAKTYGSFQISHGYSVHLYVETPVPHMAIGANYEKLADVEGSDAVRNFGPEFKSWIQEKWPFGVLRGGDGVIGKEIPKFTKKRILAELDFLSDVADHLPVER